MFETIGILAAVIDVVAFALIFRMPADGATKALWTVFVILLPFIGAIFYMATGARRPAAAAERA